MTYPKRILPPFKDLKAERIAEADRSVNTLFSGRREPASPSLAAKEH